LTAAPYCGGTLLTAANGPALFLHPDGKLVRAFIEPEADED